MFTIFINFFSFLSAVLIFLTGAIFGWVQLKKYISRFDYHYLLLGIGFIVVVANYFLCELIGAAFVPNWVFTSLTLGYLLISLSLISRWYDSILLVISILPLLLLPLDFRYIFAAFPILMLSYFAEARYCSMFCISDCEKEQVIKEKFVIPIVFVIFSSLTFFYYYIYTVGEGILFTRLATIVLNVLASMLIIWHIRKCAKFKKTERTTLVIFSILVIIFSFTGMVTNLWLNKYLLSNLEKTSTEETALVKMIAEKEFGDELPGMIENSDPRLILLTDQIHAKTGIRSTFFKGEERVAAAPSALGNGRMIGTKIDNEQVVKSVLYEGRDYVGFVIKGNEVSIAAYSPIENNERVIGMVGSGKFLDKITTDTKQLFFIMILIVAFFAAGILGHMFYSEELLKIKRQK